MSKPWKTILLVEDNAAVRQLTTLVFERAGYTVLEAASGDEALSVWDDHGGGIDLLVADLILPGQLTGQKLAARLCGLAPDLKVIFTSGGGVNLDEPLPAAQAASLFLGKPYYPGDLLQAARQLLGQEP